MTDNKNSKVAQKKKVTTHKPKLAHKLARYVRATPVHLRTGANLPSVSHFTLGGAPKAQLSNRGNTWYPSDDVKEHFKRKRNIPRARAQSKTFTAGKVLILLAGKFRGKRVVFLKQLTSGLLLVTGPHKLNGVPLRRVNPAYVIATSASVPLDGVNVANVDDAYFRREAPKGKVSEENFKGGKRDFTEEQKKANEQRQTQNRATQKTVDAALLANVKKTELLGKYLSARFTLYNNTRPHELKF